MFKRVSVLLSAVSAFTAAAPLQAQENAPVLAMHFSAPVATTTAAFGPLAESRWAPDFRPRFLRPSPARDVEGAVFRTADGRRWLLHDFRPQQGKVEYVISGDSDLIVLDIDVTEERPGRSRVVFRYDVVPFDGAGDEHLARLREHISTMRDEMQNAVSTYLAGR